MKLLSLNKKIFLIFILFIFSTNLFSEDSVDIWKKENLNKKNNSTKIKNSISQKKKQILTLIFALKTKLKLVWIIPL